jgi:hypothetical protein
MIMRGPWHLGCRKWKYMDVDPGGHDGPRCVALLPGGKEEAEKSDIDDSPDGSGLM